MDNPFKLTRAADLDDDQILSLWVDPEERSGVRLRPSSQLPMIIFGSRGSGKTHLMRYYSYPIQRKVYGPQLMRDKVKESGFIGIHTRCRGLNSNRFSGERLREEQWSALFSYYLDLWLGQMLLRTAREFLEDAGCSLRGFEESLVNDLSSLFDDDLGLTEKSLNCFADRLRDLQRDVDRSVNNAAFRRPITPKIIVSPGVLIFGIPKVLASYVNDLSKIVFTLFIDEYEHLYEEQQKYFNTLIRERENPVSFKVGVRLHGMRTYETLGGNEELREGSDYEVLILDAKLRENADAYYAFSRELCMSRIKFAHGGYPEGWNEENAKEKLNDCFRKGVPFELLVKEKLESRGGLAPWMCDLKNHLMENVSGMRTKAEQEVLVQRIISKLLFPDDALIEKTNTFLFYKRWSRGLDFELYASEISESARCYFDKSDISTEHARNLSHFRVDLKAQMLKSLNLSSFYYHNYLGLDAWIKVSDGIARNLITILKCVFDWAMWRQEDIYSANGISLESQSKGTNEASEWFISDAKALGVEHEVVQSGLKRIASLMKTLRFSEKPPECSLCAFSVDLNALPEIPRRAIETSERWSLLIRMADRIDRNSSAKVEQYRINRLVCPSFELPLSSRGVMHLSANEANVVFGGSEEREFSKVVSDRKKRSSPPFKVKTTVQEEIGGGQDELDIF